MKKRLIVLNLCIIGFTQLSNVSAATINAIKSGNWSDSNIWEGGIVPGDYDVVVIDGFTVTVNDGDKVSVGTIKLSNSDAASTAHSVLEISKGVTLTILEELRLESTDKTKNISVLIYGAGARLQVNGDIYLDATGDGQIDISLSGGSDLALKGKFVRPNGFGSLLMEIDCALILNGSDVQNIPILDPDNSGNDAFLIPNLVIDNKSDITLDEPLRIIESLTLTIGKIFSSEKHPVIVEDYATILNASSDAYVVGPVVKRGRTDMESFTFPIGSDSRYAPITVSKISDEDSEYKALYRSDPPPYGTNYGSTVKMVDPTQYWELDKVAGKDRLAYTLSWSDGAASSLSSLSSTIVVKLNEDSGKWENLGQGDVSGGTGSGELGSVQSIESDPPPYGVSRMSIGVGNPSGPLPVALISFLAKKDDGNVHLYWKTASEINSKHYEIERSADGSSFEWISTTKIEGDSESIRDYLFTDYSPNAGANYYRLKIVDFDGRYEYSNLASVILSDGSTILISPNPVYEYLTIEAPDEIGQDVILEIYDRAGTLIHKGGVNFEDKKVRLNTSDLLLHTPGAYFLRLSGNTSSKMFKFMKL